MKGCDELLGTDTLKALADPIRRDFELIENGRLSAEKYANIFQ